MDEQWKWIPRFEFRYEISNLGRIRGMNEGEIVPVIQENGLSKVVLRKNGQTTNTFVHFLLATTFIPNPQKHRYIRWKDGNKQNLSLDNLEWFTPDNQKPSPVPAQNKPKDSPFNKPVKCTTTGKIYKNMMLAAREYGVIPIIIKWLCDNDKPLPTDKFEYVDENEVEAIEI